MTETKQWTDQQEAMIEAVGRPIRSRAARATAGAGKTNCAIEALVRNPRSTALFAAFNRKIVEETKRDAPANMSCRTMHSVAYGPVGRLYAEKLKKPTMTGRDMADALRITSLTLITATGTKTLLPATLMQIVLQWVSNYCSSVDARIKKKHLGRIRDIDADFDWSNHEIVARHLWEPVNRYWADQVKVDGLLQGQHDSYLKLWSLYVTGEIAPQWRNNEARVSKRLKYDVVVLDEFQDCRPSFVNAIGLPGCL